MLLEGSDRPNALSTNADEGPALQTIDRAQRSRRDIDLDPAAAARIETVPDEPCLDLGAHTVDDRQEAFRDEVERRGEHVVNPTLQHQP